ncbi:MAG: hypothetical protein ABIE07_05625 [Candidatus Zixiibacteriota bacterium]
MFGSKKKPKEDYEDPATKYGRMVRDKKGRKCYEKKPSLLSRIFSIGHDSDFVYHED